MVAVAAVDYDSTNKHTHTRGLAQLMMMMTSPTKQQRRRRRGSEKVIINMKRVDGKSSQGKATTYDVLNGSPKSLRTDGA